MEVRHAFELLAASNPSLLDAFSSTIVYREVCSDENEVDDRKIGSRKKPEELPQVRACSLGMQMRVCSPRAIREAIAVHYDRAALVRSWYNHARYNYGAYINKVKKDGHQVDAQGCETLPVPRKKYLHCLRPLLCIEWLRQKATRDAAKKTSCNATTRPSMTSTEWKRIDPDEDEEDDESDAGPASVGDEFPASFLEAFPPLRMGCLLVATGTAFIAFEKHQSSYTAEEAKLAVRELSQRPLMRTTIL